MRGEGTEEQGSPGAGENYEIQFAVKDTGIGIPPDRMERLFKSFSQVDSSTTRQYGGTGLGLAISKRLSEMMGGRMWVESQGLSLGSTFHFTVAAQPIPGSLSVEDSQPQLAQKQLLIVDDNATSRKILTLQAQSWGMLTRAAQSGFEALDWLHPAPAPRPASGCPALPPPFDIAVLDMQMPEMDGLTLAAEIRKRPHGQALPLIMLTSLGRPAISAQAINLNFAAVLSGFK